MYIYTRTLFSNTFNNLLFKFKSPMSFRVSIIDPSVLLFDCVLLNVLNALNNNWESHKCME